VDGPLEGVAVTADAIVDLASGRTPRRIDLVGPGPATELADELRRRARGHVVVSARLGAVGLRAGSADAGELWLRVLPAQGSPAEPLTEPVLTIRAARLDPAGGLTGPGGDLAAGRLRPTDAAAFERRPEGLLHLARLAVREPLRPTPGALEAAVAARRSGAPAAAPLFHLGPPLAHLLDAPDAPEALAWLRDLAPEIPLAEGVEVHLPALREAAAETGPARRRAILRALAPGAANTRLRAFVEGTRLEAHRFP
jgi:hypothetical protein